MTLRDDQIRLLEAMADGRLEGEELAEAERLVAQHAEAAAMIDASREADALVRRLYPVPEPFVPAPPATLSIARAGTPSRALAGRPAWIRWALAAGLLLAAAGAYVTNFVLIRSPDSLRSEFIASGFVPSWTCKDDAEFIDYSATRAGQAFLIAPSASVSVLGWDSGHELISENTVSLWATSGDVPVVLFIDSAANDRSLRLRPFSGMSLYRGQLGETVFYEVSPLDGPVLLPLIHRPGESPGQVQSEVCEGAPFTPRQYPTPGHSNPSPLKDGN